MTVYAKQLAVLVVGAFLTALAGYATADGVFNILTFDWKSALTGSASTAFLTLLGGLAARFQGDPSSPLPGGKKPLQ